MATPTSLKLDEVRLTGGLLGERARTVREVMLPYQWEALNDRVPGAEPSGAVANFRVLAGDQDGGFQGIYFQDSDLAKWLEAASYRLHTHPDPALAAQVNEAIDLLRRAQAPDGYLNAHIQLLHPDRRWANLRDWHELYCAGHLIEAAVAHHDATGEPTLLDVARRLADLLVKIFGRGEGQIRSYGGHEEIELALVKLARATGERRYLELASYFIEERGREPNAFELEAKRRGEDQPPHYTYHEGMAYYQAHRPVRAQTEPRGHAVRAMYLYAAMADLARVRRDGELGAVGRKLWEEVVARHLYVIGGVGADALGGERFSAAYDLPDDRAYAETCAAIGLMMWARRLLDLELRGEYGDVMERALYNNVLSGMALDGRKFFYVNPLAMEPEVAKRRYDCRLVKTSRVPWFGCACCPPNLARLVSSLGHYAVSRIEDGIALHLLTPLEVRTTMAGGATRVRVETAYPWDGDVRVTVEPARPVEATLAVRVPGWCRAPALAVNGEPVRVEAGAYARLHRTWRAGDVVELRLPMPVERVRAHPAVGAAAGRVALQRGPVVYCVEEVDHGPRLASLAVAPTAALEARFERDMLGGVVVITGEARRVRPGAALYGTEEPEWEALPLRAVPYAVWNNRGEGEMRVWVLER